MALDKRPPLIETLLKKGRSMVRKGRKAGFTLIELMIVVAIVGILAAVAIPSYSNYTVKTKISEVSHSFDALATAVAEYHATMAYWPEYDDSGAGYMLSELVSLPSRRAAFEFVSNTATSTLYNAELANISSIVDGCVLVMNIVYDETTGYAKTWDRTASSLDAIYIPRE